MFPRLLPKVNLYDDSPACKKETCKKIAETIKRNLTNNIYQRNRELDTENFT